MASPGINSAYLKLEYSEVQGIKLGPIVPGVLTKEYFGGLSAIDYPKQEIPEIIDGLFGEYLVLTKWVVSQAKLGKPFGEVFAESLNLKRRAMGEIIMKVKKKVNSQYPPVVTNKTPQATRDRIAQLEEKVNLLTSQNARLQKYEQLAKDLNQAKLQLSAELQRKESQIMELKYKQQSQGQSSNPATPVNTGASMTGQLQMENAKLKIQCEALKEMPETAFIEKCMEKVGRVNTVRPRCSTKVSVATDLDDGESTAFESASEYEQPKVTYAKVARKKPRRKVADVTKKAPNKAPTEFVLVAESKRGQKLTSSQLYDNVKIAPRTKHRSALHKASILRVKEINGDRVLIVVQKQEDTDLIMKTLTADPTLNFVIRNPKTKRPLIKVLGIQDDRDSQELAFEIMYYNLVDQENRDSLTQATVNTGISYCYKKPSYYRGRKTTHFDYVYEVDPEIESKLLSLRKIKIDMQMVNITRQSRMTQCYRCCQYGHTAKRCPLVKEKKEVCGKCMGNHDFKKCTAPDTSITCANCVNHNNQVNTGNKIKIPVNHTAFDPKCPCRKRAREMADRITEHL